MLGMVLFLIFGVVLPFVMEPVEQGGVGHNIAVYAAFVIYLIYSTFLAGYVIISIRSHMADDDVVPSKVKPEAEGILDLE